MKRYIFSWVAFCGIISFLGACSPSEDPNRPNPITIPYAQESAKLPAIPRTVYFQTLTTNVTQVIFSSGYQIGNYYTFEHEGHLYVASWGGNFIHSPACPCLKDMKFEKE